VSVRGTCDALDSCGDGVHRCLGEPARFAGIVPIWRIDHMGFVLGGRGDQEQRCILQRMSQKRPSVLKKGRREAEPETPAALFRGAPCSWGAGQAEREGQQDGSGGSGGSGGSARERTAAPAPVAEQAFQVLPGRDQQCLAVDLLQSS